MKDHWYWSFNFNLISFLSIKMISQQTCERLNWMKIKESYCFIIISSWIFLVETQSLVNSQIVKPVIMILAQFLGSVGFKMSLIWSCSHHQWLFTILEYTIGLLACHEIRMKLERRTVGKGWLGVTLISPTVSSLISSSLSPCFSSARIDLRPCSCLFSFQPAMTRGDIKNVSIEQKTCVNCRK